MISEEQQISEIELKNPYSIANYRKGREEAKIEMAKNFLKMGLSIEQISEGTGLTVEEIRKLEN